jgi:hypothetical protein
MLEMLAILGESELRLGALLGVLLEVCDEGLSERPSEVRKLRAMRAMRILRKGFNTAMTEMIVMYE